MKPLTIKSIFFLACIILFTGCKNNNQIRLDVPKIFGDHMVLQRDKVIPIWGTATPGSKIKVKISDRKETAISDEKGNWKVKIPAMESGGPYELIIDNGKKIIFNDILIGDVWFASGQSNMEFGLESADHGADEIAGAANYPNIRLFTVPRTLSTIPRNDLSGGEWLLCDSSSVKNFSAVAYFFGKYLNKKINVPIGLIHSSWGGTPVESWTSREKITSVPVFKKRTDEFFSRNITDSTLAADIKNDELRWTLANNSNQGLSQNVPSIDYSDKDWKEMTIPQSIDHSDIGPFEGIIWFRKSFRLSEKNMGKDLILKLGKIALKDVTYFNGDKIGESSYNEDAYRTYVIPSGIIREGLNVITIRVTDLWGEGGLIGPVDSLLLIDPSDKNQRPLKLAGSWKYNEGIEPKLPETFGFSQEASLIYNGMVAPVAPFCIKGFIWYQGEANAGRAYQYRTLFPLMIKDWREQWQEGDLPFLFVQLANYSPSPEEPAESDWAELREAQLMTLNYPYTGMAVSIDIGDTYDIHPKNKQDVGIRLGVAAEKIAYGRDIVYSGPVYDTMILNGNMVRIKFKRAESGLMTPGNKKLNGFSISGKDKKFYWAEAMIDGSEIIVKSTRVKEPVAVRYGWASSPDCNLYNKEGLPASPFRTDDWPGITINNE